MNKILFFGYGANRSREKIKKVISKDPGEGIGAVLEGYVLVDQALMQIPEPPREFLRKVYGNNFKSYSIKKGAGCYPG